MFITYCYYVILWKDEEFLHVKRKSYFLSYINSSKILLGQLENRHKAENGCFYDTIKSGATNMMAS